MLRGQAQQRAQQRRDQAARSRRAVKRRQVPPVLGRPEVARALLRDQRPVRLCAP